MIRIQVTSTRRHVATFASNGTLLALDSEASLTRQEYAAARAIVDTFKAYPLRAVVDGHMGFTGVSPAAAGPQEYDNLSQLPGPVRITSFGEENVYFDLADGSEGYVKVL